MGGFVDRLISSLPEPAHTPEGEEPSLRHQFIAWRSLDLRLRLLLGLIIAQVFAAAVLLWLGPSLSGTFSFAGSGDPFDLCISPDLATGVLAHVPVCVTFPAASYTLSYLSIMAGVVLLIVGIMQLSRVGSFLLLAILSIIFGCGLIGRPDWGAMLAIAIFVLMACASPVAVAKWASDSPGRLLKWIAVGLAAMFCVVLPMAFIDPLMFFSLISLLHIPLAYLFLLVGTDWAEIDDSLTCLIVPRDWLEKNDAKLYAATGLLCLFILAYMIWTAGWLILMYACPALLAGVLLVTVLKSAGFGGNWPASLPWAALVLALLAYQIPVEITARLFIGARLVLGASLVGLCGVGRPGNRIHGARGVCAAHCRSEGATVVACIRAPLRFGFWARRLQPGNSERTRR